MIKVHQSALLAVALFLFQGCASSNTQMHNPFPKQAELQEIVRQPAPKKVLRKRAASVERWALTGTLPTQQGTHPRASATRWDRKLIGALNGSKSVASEGGHCVAQELGKYWLKTGRSADDSLERFVRERCGVSGRNVAMNMQYWEKKSADPIDEEQMYLRTHSWVASTAQQFASRMPHAELGVWVGQNDKRATVFMVALPRRVAIRPAPIVRQPDGTFVVQGTLLNVQGNSVQGAVTVGAFGYARCSTSPDVKLPRFELRCQGDPNDPSTRVSIGVGRKGSLFSHFATSLSFWKSGVTGDIYTTPQTTALIRQFASPGQTDTEQLPGEFTELVNKVRAKASLQPVTLEVRQSVASNKLAPFFFEASSKQDDATMNKILLGTLAGWEVKTAISGAEFMAAGAGTSSATALLAGMLESPSGRKTILNPDARHLAIGAIAEGSVLGAIVSTYRPLPNESHNRRVARVLELLDHARKLGGKAPVQRVTSMNYDALKLADRVKAGSLSADEAAKQFAQLTMEKTNRGAFIWNLTVMKLEQITEFKELVGPKSLLGAFMVLPIKPKGYPWTVYRVVVVIPGGA